jgi:hypothetical protein
MDGSIEGRVTTESGEAIPGAVVMITGESPPHPDIALLTNGAGRYRFDDLVPGRYFLMVNAEGGGQQIRDVSVEAGQRAQLDFSLAAT